MKIHKVRPLLIDSSVPSDLLICSVDNYLHKTEYYGCIFESPYGKDKYVELILISLEDEKIEANIDDCINIGGNIKDSFIFKPSLEILDNSYIKKVIARQSQISPEYISKFIKQYNKGCIEDLEIVMEKCWINSDNVKGNSFTEVAKFEPSINDFDAVLIIQPKLTNGFVTIVEKDSCNKCKNTCKKTSTITNEFGSCTEFNKESITYTEEECLKYCLKALEIGFDLNNTTLPRLYEKSGKQYFIDWFEQNKKK